jgi:hypothetical protein
MSSSDETRLGHLRFAVVDGIAPANSPREVLDWQKRLARAGIDDAAYVKAPAPIHSVAKDLQTV